MIELRNLSIQLGSFRLSNLALTVPTGAYSILMGPSGSGKTTLLEIIAGLQRPSKGSVFLMDRDVSAMKPSERGVGYVPQDGVLFSTMPTREQLGFALRIRGLRKDRIRKRVEQLATDLNIAHLLERGPKHLSGGEKQRVALGRALAFEPKILLLDEPVSALDDDTREGLYQLLQRQQQTRQLTVLHVTHSLSEARRLGDRILRIDEGRIQEIHAKNTADATAEHRPDLSGTRLKPLAIERSGTT
ncbi:MAG: ATP-binding cassette domain-containing protein [Opitutales bacterium]